MDLDVVTVVVSLLVGLVAGAVGGLFGVGGGVLMVPVLHYGLGYPFQLATQVSLLVIAGNTPVGLWRQHQRGNVRWAGGLWLTVGGAVGVVAAFLLRPWMSVVALKVLFAVVACYAAFRLVRPLAVARHGESRAWLLGSGVAAGAAAHWLGIGGGLVMVPALVFLGVGIHQAVATSLVAVFTNAVVSTMIDLPVLVHHLMAALPLLVGAVVGIQLGVRLANRSAAGRLRKAFAVFLTLMAVGILLEALL